MLPVIHGNDRNEWFVQLTDEIHWQIADKNTGQPRGTIVMKPGDVCAMPADIRHQGFAPKRSMLMVLENGTPGLETRYALLSFATAMPGMAIAAGELIGRTGSRLHYEVTRDGIAQNPET